MRNAIVVPSCCKVPLGAARGIDSSEHPVTQAQGDLSIQTNNSLLSPATTPSPPSSKPSSPTIACATRNTKTSTSHSALFTSFLSIPISPIPFPFPSSSRHAHRPFAVSLARDVLPFPHRPLFTQRPNAATILTSEGWACTAIAY
ncbi:hypothetical protein BC827DRAFT_1380076 [Russula dissimulans]|nr:hypothetical protein BC827DRAFT_1380076 [Russula dissimulans]